MEDPNFDAEFFAIVGSMELDETGVKELVSIDDVKDQIINNLVNHLVAFEDIDTDDEGEVEATQDVLHQFINRDFDKMEGLAVGDEIVASGETFLITVESDDLSSVAHNLSDDVRLRGTIACLTVMIIPDISVMARIMDPDIENLDSETPTNKFGIAFKIENAVMETEDRSESFPEDLMVFLPLNYPQLHLWRFV